jgi:hypothetical protein
LHLWHVTGGVIALVAVNLPTKEAVKRRRSWALLFFMHLSDNRGLLWFVVIFTVFVLLAMQYGWTDSFPLSGGVPWAK